MTENDEIKSLDRLNRRNAWLFERVIGVYETQIRTDGWGEFPVRYHEVDTKKLIKRLAKKTDPSAEILSLISESKIFLLELKKMSSVSKAIDPKTGFAYGSNQPVPYMFAFLLIGLIEYFQSTKAPIGQFEALHNRFEKYKKRLSKGIRAKGVTTFRLDGRFPAPSTKKYESKKRHFEDMKQNLFNRLRYKGDYESFRNLLCIARGFSKNKSLRAKIRFYDIKYREVWLSAYSVDPKNPDFSPRYELLSELMLKHNESIANKQIAQLACEMLQLEAEEFKKFSSYTFGKGYWPEIPSAST